MGWFDWLFPKPKPGRGKDVIWLTRSAKFAGVATHLKQLLSESPRPALVFLVAHFEACYDDLSELLDQKQINDPAVYLTLARDLPQGDDGFSRAGRTCIVAAERHPLPDHDQRIESFAEKFPEPASVEFHTSLEDAVMLPLGGPSVREMLVKLGMNEDEPIVSPMVTRRLRQAQSRIAHRHLGDLPARSDHEWLQRNWRT